MRPPRASSVGSFEYDAATSDNHVVLEEEYRIYSHPAALATVVR